MNLKTDDETADFDETQPQTETAQREIFAARVEQLIRKTFGYDEPWSGAFGRPRADHHYLFHNKSYLFEVIIEYVGTDYAVVNVEILLGKMQRNRELALKWLERNLSGSVLNVRRHHKKQSPKSQHLVLKSQCFCRLDGNDALENHLGYIDHLLIRLRYSFISWFCDIMLPGAILGHAFMNYSQEDFNILDHYFYSRTDDPPTLDQRLRGGVFEIPLHWNYRLRKIWVKAAITSRKVCEMAAKEEDRLFSESLVQVWAARSLYRAGWKNLACEKIFGAEDFDHPELRHMIQETILWIMFQEKAYGSMLECMDSPEYVETPRKNFWQAMIAIQRNDWEQFEKHALNYVRVVGEDMLLLYLAKKKFPQLSEREREGNELIKDTDPTED